MNKSSESTKHSLCFEKSWIFKQKEDGRTDNDMKIYEGDMKIIYDGEVRGRPWLSLLLGSIGLQGFGPSSPTPNHASRPQSRQRVLAPRLHGRGRSLSKFQPLLFLCRPLLTMCWNSLGYLDILWIWSFDVICCFLWNRECPCEVQSRRQGMELTGLDRVGPGWTGLDRVGPGWTGLDRVGPGWTGLDRVGPGWTGLDRVGPPNISDFRAPRALEHRGSAVPRPGRFGAHWRGGKVGRLRCGQGGPR